MSTATRDAFEVFASKGPVNIPGARQTAHRARQAFDHLLTRAEKGKLFVALSHARCGEGRGEFDEVIEDIRGRIFRDEHATEM